MQDLNSEKDMPGDGKEEYEQEDPELYSNIHTLQNKEQISGKYDILIVPGYGFDLKTHDLPQHVRNRLDLAAELLRAGVASKLVLVGGYARKLDDEGEPPTVREARLMDDYLRSHHLEINNIERIIEDHSKDSIGNALFLKKKIEEKFGKPQTREKKSVVFFLARIILLTDKNILTPWLTKTVRTDTNLIFL